MQFRKNSLCLILVLLTLTALWENPRKPNFLTLLVIAYKLFTISMIIVWVGWSHKECRKFSYAIIKEVHHLQQQLITSTLMQFSRFTVDHPQF